ncbi:MAG: monovalent cation/H+ antiporter subunit D family protein [Thermodesulfovibrionales bacterium]|nr:monovalent cation/H+ antiporter subunit D family protein [Nitrospinota bacterium]MCG2710492.1 monovalent cation/H+ antiporter subunit D family protein [Thermodesulfovibrionales bacterium]
MEVLISVKPLLAVSVSLIAAFFIALTGERARNLREFWTISASVVKFGIVISMLQPILEGKVIEYTLLSITQGLELKFRVDALGIFFAITASFLWIITSFYSIGYVRSLNEHAQTRYFACFAIALSATMGVAFSANMFTTFLFYEIITLCTYPLVAHKETPEAIKGARRYITYLLGTSIAFQLLAVFMTYSAAGTLEFSNQGILNNVRGQVSDTFLIITFILFMAGITKAAMMPLHSWLPAAMVAPTPVSALLHAVAVVKTGVFVVVKIVLHIFGIDLLSQLGLGTALAYFASITIIVASIIALKQDNLKRRLAYSTISQLSYVILGVALLTPSGITGSIMHIVLHAFGKITLFFVAGAIYVAAHKTNISELDGIGKEMPFTMAAFTLGALSMIGIPPLGGFLSKWYIAIGSIEAQQLPILLVLASSTILNACYFLPIVYAAFFKSEQCQLLVSKETEHQQLPPTLTLTPSLKEAPALMVIPLVLTAIGALVLFFAPSVFLELARMVVAGVIN